MFPSRWITPPVLLCLFFFHSCQEIEVCSSLPAIYLSMGFEKPCHALSSHTDDLIRECWTLPDSRFLLLVSPKLLRCSSGEKGNLISVSKLEEVLLYQKAAARYTQIHCSALLLGHVSVLCPGLTTPEPAPAFWVLHRTPHPQNA